MNTARLKNIVILILALLNACLLFLLLSRRSTRELDYERTLEQLTALYTAAEVDLPVELIPRDVLLPLAQPQRDTFAESRFAAALLGDGSSVDSGGGIYLYRTDTGSCTFRSNGSVEALVNLTVDDPVSFCRELGKEFGYTEFSENFEGDSGTVTAVRALGSSQIYNCTLTFRFRGSTLTSASGSFLSLPTSFDDYVFSDPVTALVRFLDYRNTSGAVCTEITGLSCGYLLESSSAGTQRLLNAVRIDTDVYSYFVSEGSGEVSRAP